LCFGSVKQGGHTIGRVERASGVVEQRSDTSGRVVVCAVQSESPCADGGVEAPSGIAPERKPTDCGIVTASRKAKQCVLPFCRVSTGISAIRWRTNRVCFWQNENAEEGNENEA